MAIDIESETENINNINNNNNNNKKATKYDYLDYGNYINRILSSELFMHDNTREINWNLPQTSDKVNIINLILSLIENKKLYELLLQQSRDTIDNIKIDLHTSDMKIKSLTQENKQLNNKINTIFQRKQFLEIEIKKQTNLLKDKNKSLHRELEQIKYKDKKYQNDIRKKDKIYKQQQDKIKKLLDERDKKSYKCLNFKLLNDKISTSILNHPNSLKNQNMKNMTNAEQNQLKQQQNQLLDDNSLLQSQIAHLQSQLQTVLNENNLLRESLLKLEVNCKESLNKINDLFGNNNNENINRQKYSMPFNKETQNLINNDIDYSAQNLSNVLDELKDNIDKTNNKQNIQRMQNEIINLRQQIQELTE
eukprot:400970_1